MLILWLILLGIGCLGIHFVLSAVEGLYLRRDEAKARAWSHEQAKRRVWRKIIEEIR